MRIPRKLPRQRRGGRRTPLLRRMLPPSLKMTVTPDRQTSCEHCLSLAGLLFLILLTLPFPLPGFGGKLLVADLAVPLMAVGLMLKRPRVPLMLLLYGLWCAAAVAVQYIRGCGGLYDFAVAAYMALIFLFFRCTQLPEKRVLLAVGLSLLAVLFLWWLLLNCIPVWTPLHERMFYSDPHGMAVHSGPLMRRFCFLFRNPNLLGVAWLVPVSMLLPEMTDSLRHGHHRLRFLFWGMLLFVLCLPLFSTMSKHAVMTLALIGGALAGAAPAGWRRRLAVAAAVAACAAFGTLCLLSVWFSTYPAVRQAPWIDFSRAGNYMTHQRVYADMIRNGEPVEQLTGFGAAAARHRYQEVAAPYAGWMRTVLEPYGAADWLEPFLSFMDPHNEYLNTAVFFGLPAAALMVAFLLSCFGAALWRQNLPVVFFIPALLLAFMWDDLASKRWIWAALGVLSAAMPDYGRRRNYA